MEQYKRIKRQHQGEVLFFRLGDFYEMFFEDAVEVSSLLNLTLTQRTGIPMCGIPYHASRSYIARLLRLGKKVAVCEQVAESGKGTGPMERKVSEVITPGTAVDEDFLEKGTSNYLACLTRSSHFFSFSYIDLSTGDFSATSFPGDSAAERLRQELERIQAREMIVQESILNDYPALAMAVSERASLVVNRWADWLFDSDRSFRQLQKQFGLERLKAFGITESSHEIMSSGALIDYLNETSGALLPHVRFLKVYNDSEFVGIDESTQRNLELVRNLSDGEKRFTLFEVLDHTQTSMGRRLLKSRILSPLRQEDLINRRLNMVQLFYRAQEKLNNIRELLGKTPDLQRLSSRLALDKAHGKDMAAIKNALDCFEQIETLLTPSGFSFESFEAAALEEKSITGLINLKELLENSIAEDPSVLLTEGNLIKSGYSGELDGLKKLRDSGRKLLEDYLEEERNITGLSSLKIKYNRLIGYFFEVPNAHLSKVPSHFRRRQGLAQGERFSTDRLAQLESDINGALDKIVELEKELFLKVRNHAKVMLSELTSAAVRIAEIDVAQSLAKAATVYAWRRAEIDSENRTSIAEGRHPVVEAHIPRGLFIPNDLELDASETAVDCATGGEEKVAFALITGPNMAGKSTYLRQAALITLMAQAGSFVPAAAARLGIVDRIYCRVGASDNLARGESTFLVEMNETAYILHTATEKSLVIMDEVGRGTGTEDGLSIAQAVCEELLENIRCRTLFATHYRDLSRIEHPRKANRCMDVQERDGEIVFLRKLREGPAAQSYGIHVASLAGLSERVIKRAEEIMKTFSLEPTTRGKILAQKTSAIFSPPAQNEWEAKIINELKNSEGDELSPLEALNLIHRWKKLLESKASSKSPKLSKRQGEGGKAEDSSLFDFLSD